MNQPFHLFGKKTFAQNLKKNHRNTVCHSFTSRFILLGILGILLGCTFNVGGQYKSGIFFYSYGGNGGIASSPVSITSLGLKADRYIDQININGKAYGGDGGEERGGITLSDDEYISAFSISYGKYVDYIRFQTNKNRVIEGGGGGGDKRVQKNNIRIISIGVHADRFVDKLTIKYVENYKPSQVVVKNVSFIVGFNGPGTELETYDNQRQKTFDAYRNVTEIMQAQTYEASVEAEYYAKVSFSTKLEYKSTNTTEIKNELEREQSSGYKRKITLGQEQVGVKVVSGTIMVNAGNYWFYPTGEIQYIVLKLDQVNNLRNKYDLTGQLDTQISDLQNYATNQYGFKYYR